MNMSTLHNRPFLVFCVIALSIAGCHALVGCAHYQPPGRDLWLAVK